jgi:hypothetical protein
MGYTLGQAAKAVGMSKTSILRSIKAGRISAGRDEFGQWAIEPCELHRVYPPLADDTGTGNGTEERGVTGGETALAEANTRTALADARLFDSKSMLEEIREQRDRWQQQAERLAALAITDQRKEPAPGAASVMAAMAANPDGRPPLFMVCGPHVWGSSVGHLEGRQLGQRGCEHQLSTGVYSLLGPDFHRQDRTSFAWYRGGRAGVRWERLSGIYDHNQGPGLAAVALILTDVTISL